VSGRRSRGVVELPFFENATRKILPARRSAPSRSWRKN